MRHFLDLHDIPADALRNIIDKAHALKKQPDQTKPLAGKTLAMIFEKNSTRTRVSFEVGMFQLGGHALYLNRNEMQLGRGETTADTARVLSRYADTILLRCHQHEELLELAAYASVPIINALSNRTHPCQLMADIMTVEEKLGSIAGKTIAWVGDGNNVAYAWMSAAAKFGFSLRLACPRALRPVQEYLELFSHPNANITVGDDPIAAVRGADVVVTDAWVSMGDVDEAPRKTMLAAYQVDEALMKHAAPHAIFMHCLPAHRGEEVSAAVMDGPQSMVWDEAENRLHAQKAILLWCLDLL